MKFDESADSTTGVRDLRTGGRGGRLSIPGGGRSFPGGGRSFPGGAKGVGGIGGIILLLVAAFLQGRGGGEGGTLPDIISAGLPEVQAAPAGQDGPPGVDADADIREFVATVFNDVQTQWETNFRQADREYRPAELRFYDTPVQSGCGVATAEIGPHYCPPDDAVYIELGFLRQLARDFDAPGDFAQAYVVAHEVGHHVQNVLGTSDQVREAQAQSPSEANAYSIRLELQADCYAGVWAHTAYGRGILEAGDLEEGLRAAESVGDDRIQERAGARVDPDNWNHGSADQRERWLRTGFDSGSAAACDTFRAEDL